MTIATVSVTEVEQSGGLLDMFDVLKCEFISMYWYHQQKLVPAKHGCTVNIFEISKL